MTETEIKWMTQQMDTLHATLEAGDRMLLVTDVGAERLLSKINLEQEDALVSMHLAGFMKSAMDDGVRLAVADVSKQGDTGIPAIAAALTLVSSGVVGYGSRSDVRRLLAYPRGKWPQFLHDVSGMGVILAMGANMLPLTPWSAAQLNMGMVYDPLHGEQDQFIHEGPAKLRVEGTDKGKEHVLEAEGTGVMAFTINERASDVLDGIPKATVTRCVNSKQTEFFAACHAVILLLESGMLWPALMAAVGQTQFGAEKAEAGKIMAFATKIMTRYEQPCTTALNHIFTRDECAEFLLKATGYPGTTNDFMASMEGGADGIVRAIEAMEKAIGLATGGADESPSLTDELEALMRKRGSSGWN